MQAALEQLAGNPLFKENPGCLGNFIQGLIAQASVAATASKQDELEPLPKDMDVKALNNSGPDAAQDAAVPTPKSEEKLAEPRPELDDGDAPKPAYTAFWSQFKRQPSKQEVVVDAATGADGAGPAAGATDAMVDEKRPELSQHEREVMAYVDNQLGDPTLYPEDTLAALDRQASFGETLMDPSPEKPETILDTPNKPVETPVPEVEVTPPKPVVVPVNITSPKEHVFAPTAEDVKACLFRKTTLDMMTSPAAAAAPSMALPSSAAAAPPCQAALVGPAMPSQAIPVPPPPAAPLMPPPAAAPVPAATVAQAPSQAASPATAPAEALQTVGGAPQVAAHTSVMMNLGGVMQPVLVPLSRDAALAAGLTPSDCYAPPEPGKPSPGATPVQPEDSAADDAVTTMDDGPDSKAVMKAAYMRFHRSVNSILERFIHVP